MPYFIDSKNPDVEQGGAENNLTTDERRPLNQEHTGQSLNMEIRNRSFEPSSNISTICCKSNFYSHNLLILVFFYITAFYLFPTALHYMHPLQQYLASYFYDCSRLPHGVLL